MATALTAIQDLPLLSWAGLEPAPYDLASFSGSHRQGRNVYPYVNGATHSWTGLDPFPLPVRMHFVNGLNNRIDWFPDVWEQWFPALRDGEVGRMTHPLLGDIDAVVVGFNVSLTAQVTAGVVVDITFEQSLKDPEDELVFDPLAIQLESLASLVVEEVENAEITVPSEAPVTDITDAAAIVSGTISSVGNDIAGTINSVKGTISEFTSVVKLQNNPELQVLEDALVNLWSQFDDAGKALGVNARKTSSRTTSGPVSVAAFARQVGNTEGEIIGLNPDVLAAPLIPGGQLVTFYVS